MILLLSSKERGREAVKQILQLMNKLFKAVLKAKSPGDPDTVINATKITVVLRKELANTLNDSTPLGSELGLFRLPKLGLFQNGKFEDDTASLQVKPRSKRRKMSYNIKQHCCVTSILF